MKRQNCRICLPIFTLPNQILICLSLVQNAKLDQNIKFYYLIICLRLVPVLLEIEKLLSDYAKFQVFPGKYTLLPIANMALIYLTSVLIIS